MGNRVVYLIWFLGNYCYKHRIPILPKFLQIINRILFSCDIPSRTNIGKDVCFSHCGLGVVINPDSVIGDGVKILHNVTIGGRGNNGVPIIEDNVLIGAHSSILGGVRVGKGAIIGAHSLVLKDVPPGATVVGIPAKVI